VVRGREQVRANAADVGRLGLGSHGPDERLLQQILGDVPPARSAGEERHHGGAVLLEGFHPERALSHVFLAPSAQRHRRAPSE